MPQATMPAETAKQVKQWIDDAVASQVASKQKHFLDKVEPLLPALEKAAKTAASRSGMTPEDVFSKMAGDDGLPAYGLTSDGHMIPVARSYVRKNKQVGHRVNKSNNHQAGFDDFLRHLWRVGALGMSNAGNSLEALDKMGTYVAKEGRDGMVVKSNALSESGGAIGGYGVPPQFLNELMRLSVEEQVLGSRARKLPMSSATLTIPSLDHTTVYGAGITPFLGGVQGLWGSESGLIAESEPQFRQTELRANQLSLFMVISNILMQDQAINLDSLVTELLTDADAFYSDLAYFQGNGSGMPLGVMNAGASITVSRQTSSHFTFQDVRNMFRKLIYNNLGDLIWVVHPSVVADILGMNDQQGGTSGIGQGRLLWQPYDQGAQAAIDRPAGKQSFGKMLGIDLFLSEKLKELGTQGDVLLIDTSKYLVAERMDAMIESSPHPFFKTYQTVIRSVSRKDGQPWLNGPVTLQSGTYTASPFIVLS